MPRPPSSRRLLADWRADIAGSEPIRKHQVQRQSRKQEDDNRPGADKKARAVSEHSGPSAHHDPVVERRSSRPNQSANRAADKQQKDRPAQHRQLNRMRMMLRPIRMTSDSTCTVRNHDRLMCRPYCNSHDAPIDRCVGSLTGRQ